MKWKIGGFRLEDGVWTFYSDEGDALYEASNEVRALDIAAEALDLLEISWDPDKDKQDIAAQVCALLSRCTVSQAPSDARTAVVDFSEVWIVQRLLRGPHKGPTGPPEADR